MIPGLNIIPGFKPKSAAKNGFTINPSVGGKSYWDLESDGSLSINGLWTGNITPDAAFSAFIVVQGPGGSTNNGGTSTNSFLGNIIGNRGTTSGGTAANGDINVTGVAGTAGTTEYNDDNISGYTSGRGGASGGKISGNTGTVSITGTPPTGTVNGIPGNPPGGGASGYVQNGPGPTAGGGGGCAVAFRDNTHFPAGVLISMNVGNSGIVSAPSARGAPGRISIKPPFDQRTLTLVSTSNVTTNQYNQVDMPSGAQAGDLVIWFRQTTGSYTLFPSNWNQLTLTNPTAGGTSKNMAYRVLTSSNGDFGTGLTAGYYVSPSTPTSHVMLCYRITGNVDFVRQGSTTEQLTNNDPAAQNIFANSSPLATVSFAFAQVAGTTQVAFSTATPAWDGEINAGNFRVGYRKQMPASNSTVVDINDNGNNNFLYSSYFELG